MRFDCDSIGKNVITDAEIILDEIGIDIETVIRMTLKRITREGSVAFLLSDKITICKNENVMLKEEGRNLPASKMTKNKAVALFRKAGEEFTRNTTFASKNNTTHIYWANPNMAVLKSDWSLILNDWINREMHLFKIPANSISEGILKARADYENLIDLQISPDDVTFTDNRSKKSFSEYLVRTIKY